MAYLLAYLVIVSITGKQMFFKITNSFFYAYQQNIIHFKKLNYIKGCD